MSGLVSYRAWLTGEGPKRAMRTANFLWGLTVLGLWGWVAYEITFPDPSPLPTERGSGLSILAFAIMGTAFATVALGIVRLFISPARRLDHG